MLRLSDIEFQNVSSSSPSFDIASEPKKGSKVLTLGPTSLTTPRLLSEAASMRKNKNKLNEIRSIEIKNQE